MSVMPVNSQLTREDLDALPDDGRRHELIDGAFFVTPAPGVGHQWMSAALVDALRAAATGTDLVVLYAPLDVVLGPNVVEPDIVVAPEADFAEKDLPTAPLLAAEIRSPSTAWMDEVRKRRLYEEHGVAHYWLADPTAPSLTILELIDGRYIEVAHAAGDHDLVLTAPVPVNLNPAKLTRG